MLSMLMTTEYAPAEDRHELQQLLPAVSVKRWRSCISARDRRCTA